MANCECHNQRVTLTPTDPDNPIPFGRPNWAPRLDSARLDLGPGPPGPRGPWVVSIMLGLGPQILEPHDPSHGLSSFAHMFPVRIGHGWSHQPIPASMKPTSGPSGPGLAHARRGSEGSLGHPSINQSGQENDRQLNGGLMDGLFQS